MRIYSNHQDNSETLSILKQYEGTDLWVKCYVRHVYDEDLGDLDGYCYIKVLKIFNRSCRVKCMPLSDGWEYVFDPEDLLEIVMENSYSVQIKNINFNIDWSAPDIYTDDEMYQLLETAAEM